MYLMISHVARKRKTLTSAPFKVSKGKFKFFSTVKFLLNYIFFIKSQFFYSNYTTNKIINKLKWRNVFFEF